MSGLGAQSSELIFSYHRTLELHENTDSADLRQC